MNKKYDLVVAGGGFVGVAAAISAARRGLSVLILEKGNCFGGAASNCLVHPFMLFRTHAKRNEKLLCRGIFEEIGNADIAYMAGCDFALGRKDGLCQPMTLCFRLVNVDTDKIDIKEF